MYLVILHLQEPQESILALCNGNKFPSVPSCSCTPHSLSYTDVRTHTHSGFPCLQSRANLRHWTQSSLSLIPLRIPRVILATSWVYIFHPHRCFHIGKKITSTPLLPFPSGMFLRVEKGKLSLTQAEWKALATASILLGWDDWERGQGGQKRMY